jgi:hypothetical protein
LELAMTGVTELEPTRLRAEIGEELVAGFPQWIVVEFDNPDPRLGFSAVAPISPAQSCPELSLIARRGQEIVAQLAPVFAEDQHGLPTGPPIGPGQRRAGLFDLDAILALAPGDYQLVIEYPATRRALAQTTLEIHLHEPSEAERELLARRDESGWMLTILCERKPLPMGPEAASLRCHELLRLHDRLHAALWRRDLGHLEVHELFSAFNRTLDAPASLFGYELAVLEEPSAAQNQRAGVLARWPGWRWWVEAADARVGPLALLRERQAMLGESPGDLTPA